MTVLDRIFVNARLHTQDPNHPEAHQVGVLGGRIVGVDDDLEGLRALDTVDLGGAFVVPGFNDAHHHISQQGERLQMTDLAPDRCGTVGAVLERLRADAPRAGDGWLLASGYDQHRLGRYPTLAELDAVTGDVPLWMLQSSGHLGMANTAGMRRAGIDPDSPPPGLIDGGFVESDREGRATGLITEGAMTLVTSLLKPTPLEEWVRCIGIGSAAAIRDGITSATEPGVIGPALSGNGPDDVAAFQLARERGLLQVRMTLFPEATTLFRPDGTIGYGGARTGLGDEWIRLGATKFFIDGSLLGQTAAVSEPFETNGSLGEYTRDPEELTRDIVAAHVAGWQIAAHAIGDRAVRTLLDALEQAQHRAPRADTRPLVEHAAITSEQDIARMVALGAVPVPQAHFVGAFGDGMRAALGDHRVAQTYRQASFLRAGLTVPGSSDCPVTDGAPLLGIHDLVNRTTHSGYVFGPQERLTVEQAIHAYTWGSAYSNHEEGLKGTIAPGMLADFTVLNQNLLALDPEGIRDTKVLQTIIAGEIVHSA